jgi:hypothetical protein
LILPVAILNTKRRVERALFDELCNPAKDGADVMEVKLNDVVLRVSIIEQKADQVGINWIYSRRSKHSADPVHKPSRPVSGATDIPEEFFMRLALSVTWSNLPKRFFDAGKLQKEHGLHWFMRVVPASLPKLQVPGRKSVVFMGDAVHAEPMLGGNRANGETISTRYEKQYSTWKEDVEKSKKLIEEMHSDYKFTL